MALSGGDRKAGGRSRERKFWIPSREEGLEAFKKHRLIILWRFLCYFRWCPNHEQIPALTLTPPSPSLSHAKCLFHNFLRISYHFSFIFSGLSISIMYYSLYSYDIKVQTDRSHALRTRLRWKLRLGSI